MLGGEVSADISPKNFNCFVIGLLMMMQFRQFLHDESASIVQQEKRHANWDFAPYQIKVCLHRKSDIRLCFFYHWNKLTHFLQKRLDLIARFIQSTNYSTKGVGRFSFCKFCPFSVRNCAEGMKFFVHHDNIGETCRHIMFNALICVKNKSARACTFNDPIYFSNMVWTPLMLSEICGYKRLLSS